jgi:hypothetical protein
MLHSKRARHDLEEGKETKKREFRDGQHRITGRGKQRLDEGGRMLNEEEEGV